MITIIKAPYEPEDFSTLQQLYAKRYELFVEGRGWRGLERPDRLDIDEFDDERTIYIIKMLDGDIVGGARLRPTLEKHMLNEVFGRLCDGGRPPMGATIYECSRTFVARRHPQRRAIFAEILLTAAQFCVENGVDRLTGILETWWLNSYLSLGLDAQPLGMPQESEGMSLLAVSFRVDREVVNTLKTRLSLLEDASARKAAEKNKLHAA